VQLFWLITVPIVIVVTVLTIVDIVRRKTGGWTIAGWILLVIAFPVIGSLIYWVTRKPEPGEAEQAYLADADIRNRNQRLPSDPSGL
jgi:hypothetical protein